MSFTEELDIDKSDFSCYTMIIIYIKKGFLTMKALKKLTALLITLILAFSTAAFAENEKITVTLDGEPIVFDVQPQFINDRTMVPIRAVSDALGAFLVWNPEDFSILLTKNDTVVMLQIDNPRLFKNNDIIELDSPPVIVDNSRTLVPLRAISESFGINVEWVSESMTVVLTTPKQ